jgi:hypothetical protein
MIENATRVLRAHAARFERHVNAVVAEVAVAELEQSIRAMQFDGSRTQRFDARR